MEPALRLSPWQRGSAVCRREKPSAGARPHPTATTDALRSDRASHARLQAPRNDLAVRGPGCESWDRRAVIPVISEHRTPSRPTTTPAQMPVIAPSIAKLATIRLARSRPSESSLPINGMVMMALPIWAEATIPLAIKSRTCALQVRFISFDLGWSFDRGVAASQAWRIGPSGRSRAASPATSVEPEAHLYCFEVFTARAVHRATLLPIVRIPRPTRPTPRDLSPDRGRSERSQLGSGSGRSERSQLISVSDGKQMPI